MWPAGWFHFVSEDCELIANMKNLDYRLSLEKKPKKKISKIWQHWIQNSTWQQSTDWWLPLGGGAWGFQLATVLTIPWCLPDTRLHTDQHLPFTLPIWSLKAFGSEPWLDRGKLDRKIHHYPQSETQLFLSGQFRNGILEASVSD